MSKRLHIVCLEAPAPPDYGGAIDMYYKIKALAESDIAITLHYFNYKKNRNADVLKQYCDQVFSYHRKSFFETPTFSKPHIVASRINEQLIRQLNADDHAILLEGIHCTGIIPYLKNKDRKIVVRVHNDESSYYQHLAKAELNFFKRSYYAIESRLLKQYQRSLPIYVSYATLSQKDTEALKRTYGIKNVFFVPAFIPWTEVTSLTGSGDYCLYHGNLAVAENEATARWLVQAVFCHTDLPLVIAGKDIPERLINVAASYPNIRFQSNPTDTALTELIQNAHIHVLPDFNKTGVKLKLLHALFCGRFCITSSHDFEGSDSVALAQTPEEYMRFLKSFSTKTFTEEDIMERQKTLRLYNNKVNAETLKAHLW